MHLERPNTSLKYPLFLGSMAAVAGLGYLYYRSIQNKSSTNFELSRKQVIVILKEFRKEFYPIFKYLTNLSQTIQNDYKKKFNYIPDNIKQNLHTMLVDENPALKEQIYIMEDRVYSKFDIQNRPGFEAYVLRLSKIDPDVQALVNEIKNDFRKSVMGLTTTESVSLPDIVTPNLILSIYKDSLKTVLERILAFIEDYKEKHGEINAYDESFAMQLKDLNLEQLKVKILEERGLGGFDDYHPEKIFHFAINTYSKEDPVFKDKLLKMEVFHQSLMQKIFAPNADAQYLKLELNKIDNLINENEAFTIKEEKDDDEDNTLARDDWIDVQEDEPLVVQVIDPVEPDKEIIIEAKDEDILITETKINEKVDSTTITHIINNEVVEQIQEIHIHPVNTSTQDTFIHAPEDSDILISTESAAGNKDIEILISTESTADNKDVDILIPNTPDIQLIISNDEAPTQETHNTDFVKTGEPIIEEISNNDFEINEPELKPIAVSVPEIDEIVHEDKPRLNLDD